MFGQLLFEHYGVLRPWFGGAGKKRGTHSIRSRPNTLLKAPIPSEFSYLGDGVGLAANNNGGCSWAVGGVGSDDISGVNDGVVGPGRNAGSHEGNGCEGLELHLDGF